jgi:hypothetical protein
LWDLWWMGIPIQGICPLRMIDPVDIVPTIDKVRRSKAVHCMGKLTQSAIDLNLGSIETLRVMPTPDRDVIFEKAFLRLCNVCIFPNHHIEELDKRRIGELSYLSLYEYFLGRRSLHS